MYLHLAFLLPCVDFILRGDLPFAVVSDSPRLSLSFYPKSFLFKMIPVESLGWSLTTLSQVMHPGKNQSLWPESEVMGRAWVVGQESKLGRDVQLC